MKLFKVGAWLASVSLLIFAFMNMSVFTGNSLSTISPINPHIVYTSFKGHIISPDGRLSIVPSQRADGSTAYSLGLLNPSRIVASPDPMYPNFKGLGTTPVAITLPDPNTPYVKVTGGHLAISFNPLRLISGSFRCDADGVLSFTGDNECFDLIIYLGDTQMKLWRAHVYVMADSFVGSPPGTVETPRNPNAKVISAKYLEDFKPQMYHDSNNQLVQVGGWEISSTADARLIVGRANLPQGRKANFMYNFSSTFAHDGWSEPASFSDMYKVTATFRGRAFKDIYPVAAQQFKDSMGKPCVSPEICTGSYPWISQDGADLFFNLASAYSLNEDDFFTRAGYSMVGLHTNYKIVTVDNALNQCRGNGIAMSTSPGLMPGMWARWYDAPANSGFPILKEQGVYPIMGTSGDYAEISTSRLVDRSYVFSLPMNELFDILRKPTPDRFGIVGEYGFFGPNRKPGSTEYHISHDLTPDISGNFLNGELKGLAAFPTEFRRLNNGRYSGDAYTCSETDNEQTGFRGKGIYFPDANSSVLLRGVPTAGINPYAVTANFHRSLYGFSMEFAIRFSQNYASSAAVVNLPVMNKPDSFSVSYQMQAGNSKLNFNFVRPNKSVVTIAVPISDDYAAQTGWHHVFLRATYSPLHKNTTLTPFLDGVAINEGVRKTFYGNFLGAVSDLTIGPVGSNAKAANGFIYELDEVALSSTPRTTEYIQHASGIGSDRTEKFVVPTLANLPTSFNLSESTWAKVSEMRIPASLKGFFDSESPDKGERFNQFVDLGNTIFNDTKLTGKNISCASCHMQNLAFTDGKTLAVGVNGPLALNSPTVLNRAFSTRQFFDGRAKNLDAQVLHPIENADEMGGTVDGVIAYLNSQPSYMAALKKASPGSSQFNKNNLSNALTAFTITRLSKDSVFDKIQTNPNSFDATYRNDVLKGYETFRGAARCTSCHAGANFTDEFRHDIGISLDGSDFKTPTLRGLSLTGPYFHDGSAKTLNEVLDHYTGGGVSRGANPTLIDPEMRPLPLTVEQKRVLTIFLEALGRSN